MKKLFASLIITIIFSGLLFSWSEIITERITSFITPVNNSKNALLAATHIQRALSSTVVGLSTNESDLIIEAQRYLQIAIDHLKEISKNSINRHKLNSLIDEIKRNDKRIQRYRELNKNITKRELLQITIDFDKIGSKINTLGKNYGEQNHHNLMNLISTYHKVNWAIRLIQMTSLLLLIYLTYSIWAKHKTDIKLKKQEKLHSLLFSSLSEAVFLVRPNGDIKSCNTSCSLLTGRTPRQLLGKSIFKIFPEIDFYNKEHDRILHDFSFIELLKKGEVCHDILIQTEVNLEKKWFSLSLQPIFESTDNDSFSIILSLTDITEKINAQSTVKEQRVQLAESAKMQSIGEIASGIAHEINNPLTIITAVSERLAIKAENNDNLASEQVSTSMEKVLATAQRMSKIVRSLLRMTREADSDDFAPEKVKTIVNIALDFCHPLLDKNNVKLIWENDDKNFDFDTVIDCNSTQISQVLLNLIKNSVDAVKSLPEKWISIKIINKDKTIRFEITDSGPGIPDEIKEQILMPFFTTKAVGEGTGLGLSISRSIIEYHRGKFGIITKNSHTCFYFEVPKDKDNEKLNKEPFKDVA